MNNMQELSLESSNLILEKFAANVLNSVSGGKRIKINEQMNAVQEVNHQCDNKGKER